MPLGKDLSHSSKKLGRDSWRQQSNQLQMSYLTFKASTPSLPPFFLPSLLFILLSIFPCFPLFFQSLIQSLCFPPFKHISPKSLILLLRVVSSSKSHSVAAWTLPASLFSLAGTCQPQNARELPHLLCRNGPKPPSCRSEHRAPGKVERLFLSLVTYGNRPLTRMEKKLQRE